MTRAVAKARKAAKRKRQPSKWVLTVAETANALNMGLNQTYEAIKAKRIPSIRFGEDGKIYVPRAAFEKMFTGDQ